MSTVLTCSIEIAQPCAVVWRALDDLSERPAWQHEVLHAATVDGLPLNAGSTVVERRRIMGLTLEIQWEVTSWTPPLTRGFKITSGALRPHGEWTLEPLDAQRTRLRTSTAYTATRTTRLLAPLLARSLHRSELRDLDTLKTLLESSSTRSAASREYLKEKAR